MGAVAVRSKALGPGAEILLLLTAWGLALAFWRPNLAHNDEAFVLWLAGSRSLPDLIQTALRLDGQPPLYAALLWLAGRLPLFHPLPMRATVGLFGAFLVYPLAFRLGCAIGGRRAGLLALALTAFNPLFAGWMMFLRAYGLALALAALSLWMAAQAGRRPGWRTGLGMGLANMALLFTFYYGAFGMAGEALWLLRHRRRRGIPLALGIGLPGLAGLVWATKAYPAAVGIVIRHQGNPGIRPDPLQMALNAWLSLWSGWAADARWAVAVGGMAALLLTVALPSARLRPSAAARLIAWAFLSAGIGFLAIGWRYNLFAARYAAMAFLPLLLGLAGIAKAARPLWRALWIGGIGLAGLMGTARTMAAYRLLPENNPWYLEVTAFLEEHAAPGDVLIVQAPWHEQALLAHFPDRPWRLFRLADEDRWREALVDRPTVWFLGVPAYAGNWAPLEAALGAAYLREPARVWPPPADAALIRFTPRPETPGWRPVDGAFEGGLRVEAAAWRALPGSVQVGLRIRADGPLSRPYTLFVHLLDLQGRWIAGHDAEPPIPTPALSPGALLTLWRSLPVPPGLPSGRYRLSAGWYPTGSEGWPRLPTRQGTDALPLGEVDLAPSPGMPGEPLGWACGGLHLETFSGIRLTPYQQRGPDIFPDPGRPDHVRFRIAVRALQTGAFRPRLWLETEAGVEPLLPIAPPFPDLQYHAGDRMQWVWEAEVPPLARTWAVQVECPEGTRRRPFLTWPRRRWRWNYSWIFWNRMP